LVRQRFGQSEQSSGGGHQAAFHLRQAELRIASGDDQVAAEGQLETARQRPPLDRGDQRLLRWSLGQTTEPPPRQRGTLAPGERLQVHSGARSEEHTSELQSRENLVCRLLLEKKKSVRQS